MKSQKKLLRGFTLIELLVVVGILALLLAITLVAINPKKQLDAAAETKRRSEATQILNAISQYEADNDGSAPFSTTTPTDAGTLTLGLCGALVPTYIAAIPVDGGTPEDCVPPPSGDFTTGYEVSVGASNRITVSSTNSTSSPKISVSR